MSCNTDITYQEFRERAINKEMIFEVSQNDTVDIIAERLKATQEYTELKDSEYYLSQDDVKIATKDERISGLRNKVYKKIKVQNKYLGESNIQSEGGTYVHELMFVANQEFAKAYKEGTSWEAARGKALAEMKQVKGFSVYNEQIFTKILETSEGVIKEIIKTQNSIDSSKKAIFFFENRIFDPTAKKYKMGTLDLLVVYSDKTFGHFDYKTLTPGGNRSKKKTEDDRIVTVFSKEPIEGIKFEGYRMPMNRYREILANNYGLTQARQVKLIPIVVNYEYNKDTKDYNKKLTYVDSEYTTTDEETREYLKSIPTSFQTTGNPKVDSSIKRLENIIEKWNKEKSKFNKTSVEYERYDFKIKRLRKSINAMYNTEGLDNYFSELKVLFNTIYKDNKNIFDLKPGEEGSFTSEELRDLFLEIDVYMNSIEAVQQEQIEVLKKLNPEQFEKYDTLYKHFYSELSKLYGKVENGIMQQALHLKQNQGVYNTNMGEVGILGKQFTRFSDYDNWIFQTASSLIQEAMFKKNKKNNDFEKELDEIFKDIKKSGMSYEEANKALINPKTGNLVQAFKSEFYENKDVEFKTKYYKPKENWEETYNKSKEKQLKYITEEANSRKGIISDEAIEERIQKNLYEWEKRNNLYINGVLNPDAWTGQFSWLYLKPNQEAAKRDGFINEEYTRIQNNPQLKRYYDFITDFNKYARETLGVEWKQVPDTFLPWIRKSVSDVVFDKTLTRADKLNQLAYEALSGVQLMQDDTFNGERDVDGKPLNTIPKWFITPLQNADGQVDVGMKSFDIGKTMLLFADMVHNYETMSKIEAHVNILKAALIMENQPIKKGGKTMLGKMMQELEKRVSKGDDLYDVFEAITNNFLYGIQIDGEDTTVKIGNKEISLTKTLLGANNYYVRKALGLDPRVALASYLGPMMLMQAQAKKGLAFNAKQNKQAHKILAGVKTKKMFSAFEKDAKLIPFIMEFFQTHTEKNVTLDARKFSQSFANKHLNTDSLFKWMRDGETAVDTHLTLVMSMNYGFNKEGKFNRIYNPDNTKRIGYEDYKSIYEILKEDFDTGSKFFESLPVNELIKFRKAVMEQSKKLKGTMTYDDKAYFQTQLLMRLMMTFKTWMPGVIGDRFGKLKYNEKLLGVDWGRYSSIAGSNAYMAGDTLKGYLSQVLLPSLLKFITETATFGYVYTSEKWKPVNEARLKKLYKQKKQENRDAFSRIVDGKEEILISYEDFKNIIIQNQKATQAELRMVLGIFLLMFAMGSMDDEPEYKNSWVGRNAYRLISRLYTELAFLYSPEEYIRLFGSSIPLIGLAKDVQKLVANTLDEIRDVLMGENSKRDQADRFYYSTKMIPGINAFTKLYELFPQDEKRDR